MKKLFLLSIMLLSVLFVNAQKNNSNPEERAQKRVDRMTKQLNLTASQQDQMYDLYLTEFQKPKVKKNAKDMSKEELKAFKTERKAARADFNNQVKSLLTDEQLAKYETSGKQRSQKGKGKVKPNKVKKNADKTKKSPEEKIQRRVSKMSAELDLDERQQEQLFALYSNRTPKVKGKDKKELSKEERQVMKEDRKQAKVDFDAALAEILTPAQLDKYNSLNAEKKGKKKSKKNKK